MSIAGTQEKFDVELTNVPHQVQAQSVFPRRTKVILRRVNGRVGVYRAGDDECLLGLMDAGLDLDGDLDEYRVDIRSVRHPMAGVASASAGSSGQPDKSGHADIPASVDNSGCTRITVRVTRCATDDCQAAPSAPKSIAACDDAHTALETSLSKLSDEGVELFSEEDLRRLAVNRTLLDALQSDDTLVQGVNRVVGARTFDEKRNAVRLMLADGGSCGELIEALVRQMEHRV